MVHADLTTIPSLTDRDQPASGSCRRIGDLERQVEDEQKPIDAIERPYRWYSPEDYAD